MKAEARLSAFLPAELESKILTDRVCRYLFGETVQGTAYVVFGVKMDQEQIRLPSVKQVSDVSRTLTSSADCAEKCVVTR